MEIEGRSSSIEKLALPRDTAVAVAYGYKALPNNCRHRHKPSNNSDTKGWYINMTNIMISVRNFSLLILCGFYVTASFGFSALPPQTITTSSRPLLSSPSMSSSSFRPIVFGSSTTNLFMSDQARSRSTKKGVKTIEKIKSETKAEGDEKKEEMWRVVLHNDEVHTFNYVIRSLSKVVGTLDRKASFEICVETHGVGKATVTKSWKKQAEQFCLGLQRQGLTVSISPDEDFDGGHAGGGI